MKITKRTNNKALANYGVDLAKVNTVDELIKAFAYHTHKVVAEADLCDDTVHYIELINGELVVYITNENNELAEVYFE